MPVQKSSTPTEKKRQQQLQREWEQEQKWRLQVQKEWEKEQSIPQRGTKVKVAPGAWPFQEVVREFCKQARQTKVKVDPSIGGTVNPLGSADFGSQLLEICAQATPMAFPIWKGGGLRIVRAPERGKFDPKTQLYRLLGHPIGEVYLEEKGVYSSGSNHYGIAHYDMYTSGREQAHVVVTYEQGDKPAKGIIIAHETHGRVCKYVTDSRGRCIVQLMKGRNYYYPLPPAGWKVYGVGGEMGTIEIQKLEISLIPGNEDPDLLLGIPYQ